MSRIFLGDCLEELRRIPSAHVDLVLTDPPYGMAYQSPCRKQHFRKIANDNNFNWGPAFAQECFRVLKPNAHLYAFCNDYSHGVFYDHLRWAGFTMKRTLIWVKNCGSVGDCLGDYQNKTEFVLFAHKGRRLLNGRRDTNVLHYAKVIRPDHPTPKPVPLCEYLIGKSTNPGDLVLDPFMGVGAMCIAAKNLGRRYLGVELDEEYFHAAKRRLEGEPMAA